MPIRAKITVIPLKRTALLADAPELAMASIISIPFVLSSRKRETIKSE